MVITILIKAENKTGQRGQAEGSVVSSASATSIVAADRSVNAVLLTCSSLDGACGSGGRTVSPLGLPADIRARILAIRRKMVWLFLPCHVFF